MKIISKKRRTGHDWWLALPCLNPDGRRPSKKNNRKTKIIQLLRRLIDFFTDRLESFIKRVLSQHTIFVQQSPRLLNSSLFCFGFCFFFINWIHSFIGLNTTNAFFFSKLFLQPLFLLLLLWRTLPTEQLKWRIHTTNIYTIFSLERSISETGLPNKHSMTPHKALTEYIIPLFCRWNI